MLLCYLQLRFYAGIRVNSAQQPNPNNRSGLFRSACMRALTRILTGCYYVYTDCLHTYVKSIIYVHAAAGALLQLALHLSQ
jgi:hypothetical protein